MPSTLPHMGCAYITQNYNPGSLHKQVICRKRKDLTEVMVSVKFLFAQGLLYSIGLVKAT
jgi:hypothetical protein